MHTFYARWLSPGSELTVLRSSVLGTLIGRPRSIGGAVMTTYPAGAHAGLIVMCSCLLHVHITMLIHTAASFCVVADLIAILVSLALSWSTFDPVQSGSRFYSHQARISPLETVIDVGKLALRSAASRRSIRQAGSTRQAMKQKNPGAVVSCVRPLD